MFSQKAKDEDIHHSISNFGDRGSEINKHMKNMLENTFKTSLLVGDMQIKINRFHYISTGLAT